MIGINSQIESPSGASAGVGFCYSGEYREAHRAPARENGYVQRPKLGINPRDVEALSGQVRLPVFVRRVDYGCAAGGAAANAGLHGLAQTENGDVELGDIIVGIDGQKINNNDELLGVLDKRQVGETVNVEVMRNGRRTVVPVKLMEAPQRRQGIRE